VRAEWVAWRLWVGSGADEIVAGGGNCAPQAGAWRGHEPPSPRRGARCRCGWFSAKHPNLHLAAGILSGGGVAIGDDGQETKTGDSRNAGQCPSLTDANLPDDNAGLRGGSAARFRLRQDSPARHAPISPDIGGRIESPRIEKTKGISSPSADGVTITAAASGDWAASRRLGEGWSEFIPILPADVASLSGCGQSAGGQSVTLFRSLGSKTDPVLHVQYPSPWNLVADFAAKSGENRKNQNWRRLLTLVRTSVMGDE